MTQSPKQHRVRTLFASAAACAVAAPWAIGKSLAQAPPPEQVVTIAAQSNNAFAFDLYPQLSRDGGNVFFSPVSIDTALGMAMAGAAGQTRTQMNRALRLPSDPQDPAWPDANQGYAALIKSIEANGKADDLSIANALWVDQSMPLQPGYAKAMRDAFDGRIANLDFITQPERSRATINRWVERQTHDRIKDLLPAGTVGPDTRLVLTNAIYFLGAWQSPFEKDATRDKPFTLPTGEEADVPMMHQRDRFGYAAMDGYQALEMRYQDSELAMLLLLPSAEADDAEDAAGGPLAGLEKRLSTTLLEAVDPQLAHREVRVMLPRFQMTRQYPLNKPLQALGMTRAFTPGQADFSGITDSAEAKRLYISVVMHKAFIAVDEQGTEAAAATGIAIAATAAPPIDPPVFNADRPFLFLIRDKTTGAILFMGRVTDPR